MKTVAEQFAETLAAAGVKRIYGIVSGEAPGEVPGEKVIVPSWPRDLVETAGGLVAAGLRLPARVVLSYLAAVQEGDGRWPQNMWLDGTAYWGGVQLDECAFPILLIDLLLREDA